MTMYRRIAGVGLGTAVASASAAFFYRPDPSESDLLDKQSSLSRKLKSIKNLAEYADEKEPFLLGMARSFTICPIGIISRAFMYGLNSTVVVEDERHSFLVDLVRNRPDGEPLLTVANHASTLDDPALFAAMMPWDVTLRPSRMRWTICSQEICFETAAIAAFFGCGKVLPIHRGGGLDQKPLLDFARRLAAGDWCHVFPEGKTVQTGTLGGRLDEEKVAKVGRLKWGVGKMIAHAPRLPTVVPFFHTGMQNVVAEDPVSKDVLPTQPRFQKKLTIRVGDPVPVLDLIEAHEKKYGPLWKYGSNATRSSNTTSSTTVGTKPDQWVEGCEVDEWKETWESSTEQRSLYSAIMRRIEAALLALESEARSELGEDYPERPHLVNSGEYLELLARAGQAGGGDGGTGISPK